MQLRVASSLLMAALLIAGCDRSAGNRQVADSPSAPAAQQPTPLPEAQADLGPVPKGLSAVPDNVRLCDVKRGLTTLVRWDVTDSGAEKVVLSVLNPKKGEEKRFGQGGPVGSKQSGPWVRPGLVFKVRDRSTNAELGSVTISGTSCY